MKKILLMAGAALLLAAPVDAAFAQGWRGGDYYGRSYNSGRDSYSGYYRFLRECQRHDRLHQELGELHAEGHYEGFDSPYDHGDQHDALDQAHDQYHADRPVSDFCDSYSQSYRGGGYNNRPYGNGGYGGNGMYNRFGYAPYRR